ncbi:ATP-dependent RNA helicase DHX36 [Neolecta irregularis DAH-3]|uniref:ATP-dependent RNA helicase DHX36 n=1 Tax=Neolecta irregularis (strain DAH-3) TaxID=1198029 RepID=A0A1U7LPT7_NEOID|nr:ATP-dependent RNA helicase DHX36 [Neolecta irregularis DAH-3]|eukprot:OLL24649.1 ATP-dependent RNA helicase DHX36 [Neolecta irregularis DAH-3]
MLRRTAALRPRLPPALFRTQATKQRSRKDLQSPLPPSPETVYDKSKLFDSVQSLVASKNLPRVNNYDAKSTITRALGLSTYNVSKRRLATSQSCPWAWEALVDIRIDKSRCLESLGHGPSSADAVACAWLHALLEIYSSPLIDQLHDPNDPLRTSSVTDTLWSSEQDALKDVYDYCGRFDETPLINRSNPRRDQEITVEISLPTQNIIARGASKSVINAHILAAIAFKQAAEEYHKEHGQSDLLVKDLSHLSTQTAMTFLEFRSMKLRLSHPRSTLHKSPIKGLWAASVSIADKELGSVDMTSKKHAEEVAYLVAAIEVKKEEPDLYNDFLKTIASSGGHLLKPLKPFDTEFDRDTFDAMDDTLFHLKRLGWNPSHSLPLPSITQQDIGKRMKPAKRFSQPELGCKSFLLKAKLEAYHANENIAELRAKRAALPMSAYKQQLLDLVKDNPVSVVIGATGSGKTTQLPQIILDNEIQACNGSRCNIICTQPRRIAATSVALRVANERNERLQETVGYQVRFDSRPPQPNGSISFCTTGVLLRQLQESITETLRDVTHIIIDEVHERDIQIDFLLVILKRMLKDRLDKNIQAPKIVLMSATIDSNLFTEYFQDLFPKGTACPKIDIPGRTFPVASHHLDEINADLKSRYPVARAPLLYDADSNIFLDREQEFKLKNDRSIDVVDQAEDRDIGARINWDGKSVIGFNGLIQLSTSQDDARIPYGLMATLIAHIAATTTEGSILVFLPGLVEITNLHNLLVRKPVLDADLTDTERYRIYMLHSSIPQMQQEVFDKLPPGVRKIILSTNIAETSITIPDVVFVVDSGKHRELMYDQTSRMSSLACTWISKSNARQRSGRAGRVQHGHYYSMMTNERFDSLQIACQPEILRADLQKICLDIKLLGMGDSVETVLSEAIQPPDPVAVVTAVQHLMALDAMDSSENLTPLGRVLAVLPVEPSLGKMVLLGVIFKCLDPVLILAASIGTKDPFLCPPHARAQAESSRLNFTQGSKSDQIGLLNAFTQWRQLKSLPNSRQAQSEFTFNNFLHRNSLSTIDQIARQILELLIKANLVKPDRTMSQNFRFGPPEMNVNSESIPLLRSLLTAGLYPNIACKISESKKGLRTLHNSCSLIHPSSVNSMRRQRAHETKSSPLFYTFSSKMKAADESSRAVFLRSTTAVDPLSLLVFGRQLEQKGWVLTVDQWLPFYVKGRSCGVILDFREAVYSVPRPTGINTNYKILSTTFARLGQQQFNALSDDDENERSLGMSSPSYSRFERSAEIDCEIRRREQLTQGFVQTLEIFDKMINPVSDSDRPSNRNFSREPREHFKPIDNKLEPDGFVSNCKRPNQEFHPNNFLSDLLESDSAKMRRSVDTNPAVKLREFLSDLNESGSAKVPTMKRTDDQSSNNRPSPLGSREDYNPRPSLLKAAM